MIQLFLLPARFPDGRRTGHPRSPDDAEKVVRDDAKAVIFHDELCEPTGDKTNNDPIDHELPPLTDSGDDGEMPPI